MTAKIRFYLGARYFQEHARTTNSFQRNAMEKVLRKAFDMTHGESACMMDNNPEGFHIECRPDQFAHFIVYRCEIGTGVNGIRDLEPVLVGAVEDRFGRIARKTGLDVTKVRQVAMMLGGYVDDRLDTVDVSDRSHQKCYE